MTPSTSMAEIRSPTHEIHVDPTSRFHTALFENRAKRSAFWPFSQVHALLTRVSDSQVSSTMDGHIILSINEGFDRLQRRLVALSVGEEIRASDAAAETGLSEEVCRAVLCGLERAGLMTHRDEDLFERRPLDSINA